MRLFTHHLHLPGTGRQLAPPPSMWRELRERLDRLAKHTATESRLRVNGLVDVPESDVSCSLCVVVNGELQRVRDIRSNGRFRLDLPANATVRLVFIQFGYLPRVMEIRPPSRQTTGSPGSQRLNLRIMLTRCSRVGGVPLTPLRERITLSHGGGPILVEHDRLPKPTQGEELWPLLKRAS